MRVADVFMCMCNAQGEVLQIVNVEEANFLELALKKEVDKTLDVAFLNEQLRCNVRASIVELVRAGLESTAPSRTRPPGQRGGTRSGTPAVPAVLKIRDEIKAMTCGLLKATQRALKKARDGQYSHLGADCKGELPVIPPAERKPPDPSRTGIAMNFARGGGAASLRSQLH